MLRLASAAISAALVINLLPDIGSADEKPVRDSERKTLANSPLTPELLELSPEEIEKQFDGRKMPEAVRMLLAIQRGSRMGASEGWFGPGESRYTWEWLAAQHGEAAEEGIAKEEFAGPADLFAVLDRDRDGRIVAADLDWSDRNPWVEQAYQMNRHFRRIDREGDGRISRDEWLAFFDRARGEKEALTSEDLREALLGGGSGGFRPGDAPSREVLLRGLAAGEIGSPHEGPALGETAPDFSLKTRDGKSRVRLADLIGTKPIVLVFGNYTCGPFRSMYPGAEDVYRRFGDRATFLAIYVREAHPTDGWKMRSNESVGVSIAQPQTWEERAAAATHCGKLLKTSMPMLIDDIDDPAGHAYSGMPARLYVIDRDGKVAYKGGRGPFGFKSGEMEQALALLLLDQNGKSDREDAGR